jgi:hypothetical protein
MAAAAASVAAGQTSHEHEYGSGSKAHPRILPAHAVLRALAVRPSEQCDLRLSPPRTVPPSGEQRREVSATTSSVGRTEYYANQLDGQLRV